MSDSSLICITEPECCARVLASCPDRVTLAPDTSEAIPGNGQYYLLAKVQPRDRPLEIEIHWPESTSTHLKGFNYPNNENFKTVLDQVCFVSPDRKTWSRLTDSRRTKTGVNINLPASREACWLSIGIPYFQNDLEDLLSELAASERCELSRIGTSRLGRPVHGIWMGPSNPDNCRGLFLIQAYQHYSEWAGLHAIDELLRKLATGTFDGGNFAWSIVPCINADALHGGWREDLMHLEMDHPNGGNLNRDWSDFHHPETRATRDFHIQNAARYPVLHGLDLHMGWSSHQKSGGGLTVFQENQLGTEAQQQEQDFTREFFRQVPIEDFAWEVSAKDRPNFSAWVWREFSAIGQTVEISRFRAFDQKRHMKEISQEYYRDLGPRMAEVLVNFYSHAHSQKQEGVHPG